MKAPLAALLHLEWSRGIHCPICYSGRPEHGATCVLDTALTELGIVTQEDRDAARLRIEFAGPSTLPSPPVSGDLPEEP